MKKNKQKLKTQEEIQEYKTEQCTDEAMLDLWVKGDDKKYLGDYEYETLQMDSDNPEVLKMTAEINEGIAFDKIELERYKTIVEKLKREKSEEKYNELILETRKLLKDKNEIETKKLYEYAVKEVKKNNNVYSILLPYMDYIKENILRDKLGYPYKKVIPNIRVFEFIADIIYTTSIDNYGKKEKLIEKVKSYYYHKYKYL